MIKRQIEILTRDHPLDALKPDIVSALSPDEKQAYSDPAAYFNGMAGSVHAPDLRAILSRIRPDQVFRLYLFSEDEKPYKAYFGWNVEPEFAHIKYRLPCRNLIPSDWPDVARHIFHALGGLIEPWADYAGIRPIENVRTILAEGTWLDEKNPTPVDPGKCYMFYDEGNGDSACFDLKGNGYFYNHELGAIEEIDIDAFMDGFFQATLERK